MTAGPLNDRLRFELPTETVDDYGAAVQGWAPQFTVAAGLTYLRGGETVLQARLAGRQVVAIRIRRSTDTQRIGVDWRAVDARTGVVMNIRSIAPTPDRAFLELTAETGVQP